MPVCTDLLIELLHTFMHSVLCGLLPLRRVSSAGQRLYLINVVCRRTLCMRAVISLTTRQWTFLYIRQRGSGTTASECMQAVRYCYVTGEVLRVLHVHAYNANSYESTGVAAENSKAKCAEAGHMDAMGAYSQGGQQ